MPPTGPIQHVEESEYGTVVPAVTCPDCGGELLHTSNGAFCDSCESFVPVVGSTVVVIEDDSDWTDDEDVS